MPVTPLPVDQFIMTKSISSSCETSDFDPNNGVRLVSGLNNRSQCLPSYLKFCYSFKELKLSVPLSNPEHTPKHNTDNLGKLFVTLFAGSHSSTGTSNKPCTRTRASARNKTSTTGLFFGFETILYRDRCATAL